VAVANVHSQLHTSDGHHAASFGQYGCCIPAAYPCGRSAARHRQLMAEEVRPSGSTRDPTITVDTLS
jgi:hypothetical protein